MRMGSSYIFLGVYIGICVALWIGGIAIGWLLSPRKEERMKRSPYECGQIPVGDAWSRYRSQFYMIALAFVVFDVEAVFLFPWIAAAKELGKLGLLEVLIFIGMLFLGWVYGLRKGVLRWG
jgi:NADH:ubiquinone oxidoreductase subunit 3 (subunit A)